MCFTVHAALQVLHGDHIGTSGRGGLCSKNDLEDMLNKWTVRPTPCTKNM